MSDQKFYVVWRGRNKGIFTTWPYCKAQVDGYPNALFKSFQTIEEAERALDKNSSAYYNHPYRKKRRGYKTTCLNIGSSTYADIQIIKPIPGSIAVDGASSVQTGRIEFRGVWTDTGKELFHYGPFESGTNNIAEFLAIVYALDYCHDNGLNVPIYSDSNTAINWVEKYSINTSQERNENNRILFSMIDSAIFQLKEIYYPNSILKWESWSWGENPADFGRKSSGQIWRALPVDTGNIPIQLEFDWKEKFGEA